MRDNPRTVARTQVGNRMVSTVSLLGDHPIEQLFMLTRGLEAAPFETMVFACESDGDVSDFMALACERYESRAEAEEGHRAMVAKVEAGLTRGAP